MPRRALIAAPVRSRGALVATRLLAATGWHVGVASPERGLAGRSRACAAWHPTPLLEEAPEGFVATLADVIARHGYDVVFGAGDAEVLAVSGAREQLGASVPYGPHAGVLRGLDKLDQTVLARWVGLDAPDTADATPEAVGTWPLPAVVKPRLHWQPGRFGPARSLHARVVVDRAALEHAVAEVRAADREPVLQRLVTGHDLTLTLLVDGERVLARVQQVGAHATPGGGEYTRSQTVPVDEHVSAASQRFLRELDWRGLAQLQFIRPVDGPPSLIDVNPRFYGSLALAASAGVDLPSRWAAAAVGEAVACPVDARPGVAFAYLEGDLRRARVERRNGLLRDALGSLIYASRHADRQWYWRDPRPATHVALGFAGDAVRLGRSLAPRGSPAASDLAEHGRLHSAPTRGRGASAARGAKR